MARNSSLLKRRRRSFSKSSSGGLGLPLGTATFFTMVGVSIILVLAVFLAQIDTQMQLRGLRFIQTNAHAEHVANKLANYIAPNLTSLKVYSQHPDVIKALQSGSSTKMDQTVERFKPAFTGVLDLRLYRDKKTSLDSSLTPKVSYACIDLFNSAEKDGTSPMEIHATNSRHQHLDVVQAVKGPNGNIIGYFQLVLDPGILTQWVKGLTSNDYVEVYQRIGKKRHVIIRNAGDETTKEKNYVSEDMSVPGTSWFILTWQPQGVSFFGFNAGLFAVLAIALILTGSIIWFMRRSVSNALVHDIDNLVGHTIATVSGQRDRAFALRMSEFRKAALRVEDILNQTSDRERDDDPSSVSIQYDKITPDAIPAVEDMTVEEVSGNEYATSQFSRNDTSIANPVESESQQKLVLPIDNKPDAPDLPPAEIFKAYDIRGIVGKTLTAKHAQLIGQALGTEAIKRGLDKIVFARDGRLSGPELGQALVQGIVRTGVSVVDVGMVPTPLLYFAAAELTNGTGVMLTGSHNPPEYNGFKMVLGGETLASEAIQDLRRRIENSDFARGKGSYEKTRIPEKYVKRIIGDVKLKRKLRIVIDCGNGVAGKIAPALYRAMGCDVTELYCDVDGNFPNHHPDPSKPENMKDLIQMVTSKRFDVGFAFDGDGDRLGVVSPNGSIIWPDRLMMLFAEDVISRNNGAQIIYDIKCSSNLTRVIWEKGGEPLMWKTGHSLIKAKMKQSGALLAGEMSGHIFFKERWYGFDDGLYSGARLLEILSKDTRTPQQVFDSLPDAFNTPELNVKMEEGEHHRFIDSFMGQADFGDANVTMIDGIRVDYDDAWGLIRASNTTPVLVLRFEGNSQEAMQRVQNEFRRQILDLNPNLNLPF